MVRSFGISLIASVCQPVLCLAMPCYALLCLCQLDGKVMLLFFEHFCFCLCFKHIECDKQKKRSLELIQAFVVLHRIGLWSLIACAIAAPFEYCFMYHCQGLNVVRHVCNNANIDRTIYGISSSKWNVAHTKRWNHTRYHRAHVSWCTQKDRRWTKHLTVQMFEYWIFDKFRTLTLLFSLEYRCERERTRSHVASGQGGTALFDSAKNIRTHLHALSFHSGVMI